MTSNKDNNRHSGRVLLFLTFVGITPLLLIFIMFLHDPTAPFLKFIYDKTENVPSVTSAFSPVMTKVMDIYGKTAPLLGIVAFLILYKRKPVEIIERGALLRGCILSPFIYCFYVYFFLLRDFELTTAGIPVRLMSENHYSLLAFYLCLYYASFLLTYMMCYLPSMVKALRKERQ